MSMNRLYLVFIRKKKKKSYSSCKVVSNYLIPIENCQFSDNKAYIK